MTDQASPDPPDLGQFLRDWTSLWREEAEADPAAVEMWRGAMALWARTLLTPPSGARGRESASGQPAKTGTGAAAAAPDPRDAALERLARRVDELEARLATLEKPRRPGRRERAPG